MWKFCNYFKYVVIIYDGLIKIYLFNKDAKWFSIFSGYVACIMVRIYWFGSLSVKRFEFLSSNCIILYICVFCFLSTLVKQWFRWQFQIFIPPNLSWDELRSLSNLVSLSQACVSTAKAPSTEKRVKKEHTAVLLKESLMKGKWLWWVSTFKYCFNSRGTPKYNTCQTRIPHCLERQNEQQCWDANEC